MNSDQMCEKKIKKSVTKIQKNCENSSKNTKNYKAIFDKFLLNFQ